MSKKIIPLVTLSAFLLYASCSKKVPLPTPTEVFNQQLTDEQTDCAALTAHDPETPVPDCRKVFDALVRGRLRIARKYPDVMKLKIGTLTVYRPKLYWATSGNCSAYPCYNRGTVDMPIIDRGSTAVGLPFIEYAYEEVLEHEATHAFMQLIDPIGPRTPEAITADPGESLYDGPPMIYLFQITCHNTPDDFAGDGPAGKRDGCAQPYSGPPNPLLSN